ncbi:MAG: hypothetical protein DRO23_11475 [Thermoprotei archaeon]|nr:MAG: hypothetical protein DRO23_11475 [Thermoprotei archaeon]
MLPLLLAPIVLLGLVLFSIILSSLPLWFASKLLGLKRSGLVYAMAATIVGGLLASVISAIVVAIIPLPLLGVALGFISYLWVIRQVYDVGWDKAVTLWLVSIITAIVLVLILSFIIILFFPSTYLPKIPHHWWI